MYPRFCCILIWENSFFLVEVDLFWKLYCWYILGTTLPHVSECSVLQIFPSQWVHIRIVFILKEHLQYKQKSFYYIVFTISNDCLPNYRSHNSLDMWQKCAFWQPTSISRQSRVKSSLNILSPYAPIEDNWFRISIFYHTRARYWSPQRVKNG